MKILFVKIDKFKTEFDVVEMERFDPWQRTNENEKDVSPDFYTFDVDPYHESPIKLICRELSSESESENENESENESESERKKTVQIDQMKEIIRKRGIRPLDNKSDLLVTLLYTRNIPDDLFSFLWENGYRKHAFRNRSYRVLLDDTFSNLESKSLVFVTYHKRLERIKKLVQSV